MSSLVVFFNRHPRLLWLPLVQLFVVLIASVLSGFTVINSLEPQGLALLWHSSAAVSTLLGGFVCWFSSTYFMLRFFFDCAFGTVVDSLKALYKAQIYKYLLAAMLFILVIKFVEFLQPVQFFFGFICVQIVHAFSGKIAKL